MADPNITEEVHFEMLEKKSDGTFKAKYPKVKSKSGVTFDEHLADNTHIPTGLISMWSGLISAIPNGWALCDGNNGTPNLKDRFIMGATTDLDIGETGGENSVKLTINEMPSHNHSGSAVSSGSHTHRYTVGTGHSSYDESIDPFAHPPTESQSGIIASAGSHTHTISIGNKGSGQPHENRPAYYTLAFIMKL